MTDEPIQTDAEAGRSVAVTFYSLNKAGGDSACKVGAWLRQLAEDVETPEFRAKVDDVFTAGYCQPLEP